MSATSRVTNSAAKAFASSLRRDFDDNPGEDIVTGWLDGVLIVGCTGEKARKLAALLARYRWATVQEDRGDGTTEPSA